MLSHRNDRAVTPVVGIIILVGITVILAGAFGMAFMGLLEGIESPPKAAIDIETDGDTIALKHRGGDPIDVEHLQFYGVTPVTLPGNTFKVGDTIPLSPYTDEGARVVWESESSQGIILSASLTTVPLQSGLGGGAVLVDIPATALPNEYVRAEFEFTESTDNYHAIEGAIFYNELDKEITVAITSWGPPWDYEYSTTVGSGETKTDGEFGDTGINFKEYTNSGDGPSDHHSAIAMKIENEGCKIFMFDHNAFDDRFYYEKVHPGDAYDGMLQMGLLGFYKAVPGPDEYNNNYLSEDYDEDWDEYYPDEVNQYPWYEWDNEHRDQYIGEHCNPDDVG